MALALRITGDGALRVISDRGATRITVAGASDITGARGVTITAPGARQVFTPEGRPVTNLSARAGEVVTVDLILKEDDVALGDLSAAVCSWTADSIRYPTETISGSATGGVAGAVTLSIDLADDVTAGNYSLWVQVDGLTWPTTKRTDRLMLSVFANQ